MEAQELIDSLKNRNNILNIKDNHRIQLLAIALNYPKGNLHTPVLPSDLEELEAILKKHYRP